MTHSHPCIAGQPEPRACEATPTPAVGQGLHQLDQLLDFQSMLADELERTITNLGKLMERAARLNAPEHLRRLHELRMQAIRARSPAHQAAMHAEIDRRIAQGGVL